MNDILELEKSLFKLEYMSDKNYLNNIIDDNYLEIGKSGIFINKEDVINELTCLDKDRDIDIYNYSCLELSNNVYLVHYVTISNKDYIYRTSIWKKDKQYKIIFHQASILKEDIKLIKY